MTDCSTIQEGTAPIAFSLSLTHRDRGPVWSSIYQRVCPCNRDISLNGTTTYSFTLTLPHPVSLTLSLVCTHTHTISHPIGQHSGVTNSPPNIALILLVLCNLFHHFCIFTNCSIHFPIYLHSLIVYPLLQPFWMGQNHRPTQSLSFVFSFCPLSYLCTEIYRKQNNSTWITSTKSEDTPK